MATQPGTAPVAAPAQSSGSYFSWLKMPSFSSSSTQPKVVSPETIAKCDKEYNDTVAAAGTKRDKCKSGNSGWFSGGKKRRSSKKANKKTNKKGGKKSKSQKKR